MKDFNFDSIRERCWAVSWDVTGSISISISNYAVDIGAGDRDVSTGAVVVADWDTTAVIAIVVIAFFGDAGRNSTCGVEFCLESH